jgi:predicted RNA binding protein YcfA (HicA-like mRNA interferase family)
MPMSGKEMLKLYFKDDWELDHINGSHHIVVKNGVSVSIPVHKNTDLKKGL